MDLSLKAIIFLIIGTGILTIGAFFLAVVSLERESFTELSIVHDSDPSGTVPSGFLIENMGDEGRFYRYVVTLGNETIDSGAIGISGQSSKTIQLPLERWEGDGAVPVVISLPDEGLSVHAWVMVR